MPPAPIDPIALAQALIRRPSVTPVDAGALDVLEGVLEPFGFACERMRFESDGAAPVENLYARLGTRRPHLCFAGHTDVVPAGDEAAWSWPPFGAEIREGKLTGRGAADMKGAIGAFAAALSRHIIQTGPPAGSVSFLITGDEEGPAVNGTVKMLQTLAARGETIDHCLVGEPTSVAALGDMAKIGRRGSLNAVLTVEGRQGHVAYPHLADNPNPKLLTLLSSLIENALDDGYERFDPSSLQITDLETGNPAHNVIPGAARARFNIRFNPNWAGPDLEAHIRARLDAAAAEAGVDYRLDVHITGSAFLSEPDRFTAILENAIEARTGLRPQLSTAGGTSDARFIKDYAKVVEFGLVGATIHKVDEFARVEEIETLTEIYGDVIAAYFNENDDGSGRSAS